MALIAGCHTGKHPAAPLPGHGGSREMQARLPHMQQPLRVKREDVKRKKNQRCEPGSLRRCVIHASGIPAVSRESPGKATPSDCPRRCLAQKLCHKRKKRQTCIRENAFVAGSSSWSKYRRRVSVSLWLRTHRMGETLQCTTNAGVAVISTKKYVNYHRKWSKSPCVHINFRHKCRYFASRIAESSLKKYLPLYNLTNRLNTKQMQQIVVNRLTLQQLWKISRQWTNPPSITHHTVISRWFFLQRNRTKSTIVASKSHCSAEVTRK